MGGQPAGDSGAKPATDPARGGTTPEERHRRAGGDAATAGPRPGRGPSPEDRRLAAVVAGHQGRPDEARAATADPEPAVRAAGYGALARLGRWDAATADAATGDPDAAVRRRACELCGRQPGPAAAADLVPPVVARLADDDATVAEMAAWALGELVPAAAPGGGVDPDAPPPAEVAALAALSRHHPDPLAREAAVASLGAIGHPAGLDAVLHALDGKPPLRRRAAVALAAFDDPRADEALTRCLADRDWQVREVAEELLGQGPTS